MKITRRWLVLAALVVATAAAAALAAASTGRAGSSGAFRFAHRLGRRRSPAGREGCTPRRIRTCKLKIVTFDGDGNGATTMQTKIQLWNRTGHGWPDVIFSEQANDPVWMGQKPFDFAMDLNGVFPKTLIKGWPAPSLAQCTVNGRLVCLQDNLAQEVLYVNQKLMKQFGYQVPKTWQHGRRSARRSPRSIPATSSATSATRTARGSTCGPTSARSRRSSGRRPSGSTQATCTARAWRTCSIR